MACATGADDKTGAHSDDAAAAGPPAEVCNGRDDDGDGEVDEGLALTVWYVDDDADGHGGTTERIACAQPTGTAPTGDDCDDADPRVHPSQAERCNGIDDDCDGELDGPTAVDAVTVHPDTDGDGYGLAAERRCLAADAEGWTTDSLGLDCDDTDPLVFPGAPERCNGIDDDCLPATTDAGSAVFVDAAGERTDWPAGTLPERAAFLRPGTLQLCAGTHTMVLRPRADLVVEPAPTATDRPRISGLAVDGPALLLRDTGLTVTVQGVDLEGGLGTAAIAGEAHGGGAVECDTDGRLVLAALTVSGGEADLGGSVLVRGGCALEAADVVVERGRAAWAGGLVAVLDGTATFTDSDLAFGAAPVGAGVAVVGWEGPASVVLDGTNLHGSTADRLGGGAYVEDATLTCLGDLAAGTGLYSNAALEGGGVWLAADGTFDAVDCDMAVGVSDNLVHDVAWDSGGTFGASWAGPATFTCTDEGCE